MFPDGPAPHGINHSFTAAREAQINITDALEMQSSVSAPWLSKQHFYPHISRVLEAAGRPCLLVPSLSWGFFVVGEMQFPKGAGAAHSTSLLKIPTSRWDFQAGFGQARSGQFSTGLSKVSAWTQGCSHMDFMAFFARCVRTNIGQSYQRSVILPVICTEDSGGRGWQREGEESSLLQVSGDIPLSQVS